THRRPALPAGRLGGLRGGGRRGWLRRPRGDAGPPARRRRMQAELRLRRPRPMRAVAPIRAPGLGGDLAPEGRREPRGAHPVPPPRRRPPHRGPDPRHGAGGVSPGVPPPRRPPPNPGPPAPRAPERAVRPRRLAERAPLDAVAPHLR